MGESGGRTLVCKEQRECQSRKAIALLHGHREWVMVFLEQLTSGKSATGDGDMFG